MAFNLGPSSINTSTFSPLNLTGNAYVQDVRVRDIVLDANHPRFKEVGEWLGIGTIFFDDTTVGGQSTSINIIHFARPYFSNIKFYPLLNEVVSILYIIDPTQSGGGSPLPKVAYYLPPTNLWNHPHHNSLPDPNVPNPFSRRKSYEEVEAGSPNREYNNTVSTPLGSTFKEKSKIFPLYAYEGDHIFEGRWGNTIRLGSTVNYPNFPNEWSSEGNIGDPITILRIANPNTSTTQQGWIPTVENTSQDLSSIYLTSTQKVNFSPSSFKTDSFKADDSPTHPTEYQGNQIIIDSGRLVLNAKQDGILLSSPNAIHLSAGSSVNLDCGNNIVLSTKEIYLIDKEAKERAVLGDELVLQLQRLLPALEGLANACTTAAAGPFPVPSLISAGPPLLTAVQNFKAAVNGSNPQILSKKVKLK